MDNENLILLPDRDHGRSSNQYFSVFCPSIIMTEKPVTVGIPSHCLKNEEKKMKNATLERLWQASKVLPSNYQQKTIRAFKICTY